MGYYSAHRGKSGYRIISLIEHYVSFNVAEHMKFGNGEINYAGQITATYQWKDEDPKGNDLAWFKFTGKDWYTYQKRQFVKAPFIDWDHCFQTEWIIQEMRKVLTLDEALQIKHIATILNNDWKNSFANELINKIIHEYYRITREHRVPFALNEFIEKEGYKWLALGACVEILPEEIVKNGLSPYCGKE